MDNEKLAKAITQMYTVVAEDNLDDSDEIIQEAAFSISGYKTCNAAQFAVLLVKAGLHHEVALDFCDITEREYALALSSKDSPVVIKQYKSFESQAITLSLSILGANSSGWVIEGEVIEDYYRWVNDFKAEHIFYGKVWGNFEKEVHADSQAGYDAFVTAHPAEVWDYDDI